MLLRGRHTWMNTGFPSKSSSMPSPAASAAATSGTAEAAGTMRHRCRSERRPSGASCGVLRPLLQLGALRTAAFAGIPMRAEWMLPNGVRVQQAGLA